MEAMIETAERVAAAMPSGLMAYLRGETEALGDLECELLVAVGAEAYRAERYADAAAMFRTHLLARPNSARAWCLLAMCHDAVDDLDRAASLYELAAMAPERGNVTEKIAAYRARTLAALDRNDEAERVLATLDDADLEPELEAVRTAVQRTLGGFR